MSKLRTNQIETLDGLNTKNVETLVDDINSAQVTTSTGTNQTLSEALDSRAIRDRLPLNILNFGAIGDGVTDDVSAFQSAVDSIPSGEFRHIIVPFNEYMIGSDVNQTGGTPFWVFTDGGNVVGDGRLPREWAAIRQTENGFNTSGTIRVGMNAGSPGNRDNNGGIVFGGYSARDMDSDSDGIAFSAESTSAHFMRIQCNRFAGQTQLNFQHLGCYGTCDVNGTTVTRVSGKEFNRVVAARYITINYVNYTIESIDSADQITLTSSAGTQSGVKYRIATTYQAVDVNISGNTLTRVNGEFFSGSANAVIYNGVRYTGSYVSPTEFTTDSPIGDATGVTVYSLPNETAAVVLRLQTQPGGDEQSMVWGYREADGYFLSSVRTGDGENRPLTINMGVKAMTFGTNGFVDQARRLTLNSSAFDEHLRIQRGPEEWRLSPTGNNLALENVTSGGTPAFQTPRHIPGGDGVHPLGQASNRWSAVYASSGTINTSDMREKHLISELSDAEKAVATQLKGMIRKFKWNDAVEQKGDGARWHFGVMAQEVRDAFAEHGLDAHEYGLFCYDEWDEEWIERADPDNPTLLIKTKIREAGNRYGVRYDELLAFIISAL